MSEKGSTTEESGIIRIPPPCDTPEPASEAGVGGADAEEVDDIIHQLGFFLENRHRYAGVIDGNEEKDTDELTQD